MSVMWPVFVAEIFVDFRGKAKAQSNDQVSFLDFPVKFYAWLCRM